MSINIWRLPFVPEKKKKKEIHYNSLGLKTKARCSRACEQQPVMINYESKSGPSAPQGRPTWARIS